jgi:hypothetical protein
MCVTRGNVVLAVFLVSAALPALAGQPRGRVPEARVANPEVRGVVRAVDTDKNILTVAVPNRTRRELDEKKYELAKEVEILVDDGRGSRFVRKEGKLADLHAGALVTLTLTNDGKTIERIFAETPTLQGTVKSVDAGKGTITLTLPSRGRGEEAEEKTLSVGKDAEIGLDDGRGRRFSVKEGKLADVPAGSLATVRLSLDQKSVATLTASGPNVYGIVKSVDVPKGTITLTVGPRGRGEDAEEKTFTLAKGADLLVDDGRGGRWGFAKAARLADLRAGTVVNLKQSLDQKKAVVVRAEGPTVYGQLKAVDAGKGTVTLLIGAGRRSDGEEKTFSLGKGATIFHDGKAVKLADVKVKENSVASLRLSLDQKSVKLMNVQEPRPRE